MEREAWQVQSEGWASTYRSGNSGISITPVPNACCNNTQAKEAESHDLSLHKDLVRLLIWCSWEAGPAEKGGTQKRPITGPALSDDKGL